MENGPCQPRTIDFSLQKVGDKEKQRRFIGEWFDEFGPWFEYSEKKHKAYLFAK